MRCVRERAGRAARPSSAGWPDVRTEDGVDPPARGSARAARSAPVAAPSAPLLPPRSPCAAKAPVVVAPPPPPDLVRLLADGEARVRRRAALAVGRVGLRDGVPPLVALLGDADPEVRQMAAFALGLLGDQSARDPLVDGARRSVAARARQRRRSARPDRRCRGGRRRSARWLTQIVQSGALAAAARRRRRRRGATRPRRRFGSAIYALVRLKAYDRWRRPCSTHRPAARALVAGGVRAAAARRQARRCRRC